MQKSRKVPACFRGKCEIQDIMAAPDSQRLEAQATAFVQAEALPPEYEDVKRRVLRESGLVDLDPATLLEMATTFTEFRQSKRKQKDGVRKR